MVGGWADWAAADGGLVWVAEPSPAKGEAAGVDEVPTAAGFDGVPAAAGGVEVPAAAGVDGVPAAAGEGRDGAVDTSGEDSERSAVAGLPLGPVAASGGLALLLAGLAALLIDPGVLTWAGVAVVMATAATTAAAVGSTAGAVVGGRVVRS